MTTAIESTRLVQIAYDWAADDYLRSLPLEHFMESTDQSTQREITLESLALVRAVRPDFQVFSELLIQYPISTKKKRTPERVVPDNMVVIWPEPLTGLKAFHTPLQPVLPTMVMEYVSASNRRKDYDDNFRRYRDDLHVPFYLLFEPENQSLNVFHLEDGKYAKIAKKRRGSLGDSRVGIGGRFNRRLGAVLAPRRIALASRRVVEPTPCKGRSTRRRSGTDSRAGRGKRPTPQRTGEVEGAMT